MGPSPQPLTGAALASRLLLVSVLLCWPCALQADAVPEKGAVALESIPAAQWGFQGVIAPRMQANIDHWLLCAPEANPGMLGMFRVRDRQPVPQLTPWAGEFAGKYLISCVQALRCSGRADLRQHTAFFVARLIETQADDGYLGPFPRSQRLLKHWDLWGHYHVMQGLLLWHDYSGEPAPLDAARRAADLICRTYLDGPRRVFDAGSPEMNMAVSHVLADLYLRTGEPRYRTMAQEIVKDWERAGDYLSTGVAGTPFYQTPRPRWESLHDLQALATFWRITGEEQYRKAFVSHWRTIRQFDRRNTGAFSGGERATGNAFAPSAIETCCTVAWMALSCNMLRLSGDPQVADELELSTLNAAAGAQHPSGRWWTYSTPMDGERKASAHEIVFQARAGSPELNCCSVNGPRSLGMLCDWAVMRSPDGGLAINWLGPMHVTTTDARAGRVTLRCSGDYPLSSQVTLQVTSATPAPLRLRVRIPAWARGASARLNGQPCPVTPGSYLEIQRAWTEADRLELELPLEFRTIEGQNEQTGKLSVYFGPLLLAYDQADNPYDENRIPLIDPSRLAQARRISTSNDEQGPAASRALIAPWLLVEVPTAGQPLRLRDFASAGADGTRYRSWLYGPGSAAPLGPDRLIALASLRGSAQPTFGRLLRAPSVAPADQGSAVALNGTDQMLVYALPAELGPDLSVAIRVRVRQWPADKRLGQVFSAWAAPADDPLRLTVDHQQVFARVEAASHAGSTTGVPLTLNKWYHLAAVKSAGKLTLYVDGTRRGEADVRAEVSTLSHSFAVGGNPAFSGPEFLAADFADLVVRNRALTAEEVLGLCNAAGGP